MKYRILVTLSLISCVLIFSGCNNTENIAVADTWKINDPDRPQPPVITPGENCGDAPSNAIILFDGEDTSQWHMTNGDPQPFLWKVEDGYMEVADLRDSEGKRILNSIRTNQSFGDCQLHVEWASPDKVEGQGQMRGNSGVYLMGMYEVQILDSYNNTTYPDGQASAIYAQNPPIFNVSREPGQWQSYDIVFRRPRFDQDGELTKPGYMTVFHNGVLVQDHFELKGMLIAEGEGPERVLKNKYNAHADKLPLVLQDHLNSVKFRNIWIIELPEN
ncbi:MAG: DUF1080 domain-containing protein [Sedimentisphaeraceae bacterium JB056]